MNTRRNDVKNLLIDTLNFWIYQLQNDKCTESSLQSIFGAIEENVTDESDANSISDFYGQSLSNVRSTLSRNFLPKPKRRVLYNFYKFLLVKPKSWKHR